MKTKICPKCKEEKSTEEFYSRKDSKDGLRGHCKKCWKGKCKQYNQDNYEKLRKQKMQHYQDNKDRIKEEQKQYRQKTVHIKREHQKRYLRKNSSYSIYHHQLTVDEEPRLAEDGISLEVRCKYCGKYYIPTNQQVRDRVKALCGQRNGCSEGYIYCSDGCKNSCPIFNQHLYPKDFKPATGREVQPQLRKLVLERDNWTCQKCGSTDELHCHHIDPVISNPIESADVDNCITYCVECHKEAHQQEGCKTGQLANSC